LLAGVAFVSSRSQAVQRLRGHEGVAARGKIEPFRPPVTEQDGMENNYNNWTSVTAIAAAFGLAVALVSAPVRAEEAAPAPAPAPEAAPAPAPAPAPAVAEKTAAEIEKADLEKEAAARKAALSKEQRLQLDAQQLGKESVSADFAASSGRNEGGSVAPVKKRKKSFKPKVEKKEEEKKADGGFEFKLPSFSAPEATPETSAVKKVIISPADEIDDDEKSLNATNLPLLFALFFGPSFVYIVFYVLGSLDII